MTDVTVVIGVVIGAGGIGQAIARRISSGRHVLVANQAQDAAAEALSLAGFEVRVSGRPGRSFAARAARGSCRARGRGGPIPFRKPCPMVFRLARRGGSIPRRWAVERDPGRACRGAAGKRLRRGALDLADLVLADLRRGAFDLDDRALALVRAAAEKPHRALRHGGAKPHRHRRDRFRTPPAQACANMTREVPPSARAASSRTWPFRAGRSVGPGATRRS